MTKITSAPYVAGARHPVFEAYLARVLPDDELRAFVQRLTGYCLTGSTVEEKVFFAHGPTATGKSTLLRALRSALGDYAAVADFSSFTEGRHRNGPREDLARLDGVRLVASVEVTDGSRLAEGLVKWLSGGDVIAARRLYEATFEFTPQFKLLLAANHRPKARSDDDALWRRILEVPFVEHIPEAERDPEVKRILCDPAEAGPAVLAWAAEGAAAWFTEGLGAPKAVRQATAAYREAMDPLKDFLADRCVVDPEAWTSAKELREAYDAWARELGIRFPLDGNTFAERLRSRGCTDRRRHGGARGWQGIRLRGPLDGDTGDGGDIECGKSLYARAQKESYGNGRHPASPVTLTDPAEPDWVRHDLFGDGSPEVAW